MRLVSVAVWVAAALIVFLLAYRSTGSLLLASITHFLAFCAMAFIGAQSANPQEACIFQLAAQGGDVGFAHFRRACHAGRRRRHPGQEHRAAPAVTVISPGRTEAGENAVALAAVRNVLLLDQTDGSDSCRRQACAPRSVRQYERTHFVLAVDKL